jgi:DNA topoisomerase-1
MAKNLIIVESPTKAHTIKRYLNEGYEVASSRGHILDLPESKLGIDIENDFEPSYVPIKGKEKIIKELKQFSNNSERVILATDPDREGEAIAYHIQKVIEREGERVLFYEITKKGVTQALKKPGRIDMSKVDAQVARRILDRLVGYTVSPLLWKVFKMPTLSAGRVQSVALRLICKREDEIRGFVPQEYWNIAARLQKKETKEEFDAKLLRIKPKTEKEAGKIVDDISKGKFVVEGFKEGKKMRHPKPPYITSTLQQDASANLNMSAFRTMKVAQKLFEGVDVSGEAIGLITYMRTDSVRIAREKIAEARRFIKKTYGEDFIPQKSNIYRERKGAQGAHEAIRPTSLEFPPSKVRKYLTYDQYRLYDMIWKRFLSSQGASAKYNKRKAVIKAGDYKFEATSEKLDFSGFLLIAGIKEKESEEVPKLKEGEVLSLVSIKKEQEFTKPKLRYTEGSMVKELEAKGIGRPSTYAPIISTIIQRRYVRKEKGKLAPTELGEMVNSVLIKSFSGLFDVKFTKEMEEQLDRVEARDIEKRELLSDFYGKFSKSIGGFNTKKARQSLEEVTDEICEKCGRPMVVKIGKYGRFLACSGYPECRNTRPYSKISDVEKIGEQCPLCGRDLVIKVSRYGRFIACSGYPNCKFTKPLGTGVKCPECGNEIVERRTKRGKTFYGCKNYPKCQFSMWNRPVQKTCPKCGYSIMGEKSKFLVCPKCGAKEQI